VAIATNYIPIPQATALLVSCFAILPLCESWKCIEYKSKPCTLPYSAIFPKNVTFDWKCIVLPCTCPQYVSNIAPIDPPGRAMRGQHADAPSYPVIWYKRGYILDRIPSRILDLLPGSKRDYTLLPTTFEAQAQQGYTSAAFDLEANNSDDRRVGLDEVRLFFLNLDCTAWILITGGRFSISLPKLGRL
jgi:Fungal protein of unknown function (DUF2015)